MAFLRVAWIASKQSSVAFAMPVATHRAALRSAVGG
jgi:hypothetical protein